MCLPELVQIAIPYVNLFKLFYVFTNETLFIFFLNHEPTWSFSLL